MILSKETKCALVLKLIFKRVSSKRLILSDSPPYFKILLYGRAGIQAYSVCILYIWTFLCIRRPPVYEVCGCRFIKAIISYKMSLMVVNMTCGGCV